MLDSFCDLWFLWFVNFVNCEFCELWFLWIVIFKNKPPWKGLFRPLPFMGFTPPPLRGLFAPPRGAKGYPFTSRIRVATTQTQNKTRQNYFMMKFSFALRSRSLQSLKWIANVRYFFYSAKLFRVFFYFCCFFTAFLHFDPHFVRSTPQKRRNSS